MKTCKNRVFCNKCGKELKRNENVLLEDALFVDKSWGYFSEKDLERHMFVLCEHCYDTFIRSFSIPVIRKKVTEV